MCGYSVEVLRYNLPMVVLQKQTLLDRHPNGDGILYQY